MQDFTHLDETLDLNLTHTYSLSIQASLNGLSFCVIDPLRNKYIALAHKSFLPQLDFEDYLDGIEEYLDKNELLSHSYKNSKFIWQSTKSTLIPSQIFQKDHLKQYFEFNQTLDELDEIHFQDIKHISTTSIFSIPNQIANIFTRKFPNIQFFNQQSPFILLSTKDLYSESKKVYVNINESFIDINITEKGSLLFYNNFVVKSEIDMVYFVINTLNQLKLNTSSIELILSGFIDKKSVGFQKLNEFVSHIRFCKSPHQYTYSYTFNKIPHHYFIHLFNLNHCE